MFVMTSQMEGLPMVLLEAKSWGLPLVSFDIMTGPSDIIQDGINGYLIEEGNIDEMAERDVYKRQGMKYIFLCRMANL